MFRIRQLRNSLISSFGLLLIASTSALAQINVLPQELEGIGVDEKLGQRVNLDLEFTGTDGYPHTLRSMFQHGKPILLDLVYYRCPMLCNLVLNAQTKVMKDLAWTAGKEFDVVTISIDPNEGFDLARAKRKWYLENYGRDEASSGWHFMTDYQGNVKRLAEQIGFNYRWEAKTQQFAHAAAITILTPDGRVSRYLYGLQYKTRDMRLALAEASEGKLGSVSDKVLLYCFHYDSSAKSYVPFAMNIMRAGGALTVVIIGLVLSILWRRERARGSSGTSLPDGVATVK